MCQHKYISISEIIEALNEERTIELHDVAPELLQEQIWSVTLALPGYMPTNPPAFFASEHEAEMYIEEETAEYFSECEESDGQEYDSAPVLVSEALGL
jgi:hypothetical protein